MTMTAARRLDVERESARQLLRTVAQEIAGDEELIANTIEGETNLPEAIDGALARILELKGLQEGCKHAEAAVRARRERLERQEETIRAAIALAVHDAGLRKLERPLATVGLTKRAAKMEITAEAEIPEDFLKVPDPVVDKKKLAEAVKAYHKAYEALWPLLLNEHGGNEAKAKAAATVKLQHKAIPGATMVEQPDGLNIRFA